MLTVLSFNIGNYTAHDARDLARLISEARADIIGLYEVTWIEDKTAVASLMQDLETPYSATGMSSHTQNHTLLLSKYPFLHTDTFITLQNSGLSTKIDTNLGIITLAAIHLAPSPEQSRLKELSEVMSTIDDPSVPSMIIGDLNAVSKGDPVDYSAIPVEAPTYEVTETIKQAGFTDIGHALSTVFMPTVPITQDDGIEFHNLRLDYMYINQILSDHKYEYRVLASGNPHNLSDHLPIVSIIY
ncbi:MAG: Endonuclease/exonuclease/phosphatase [Candidatus Saccharibacteria bacterium]|nr:Endonuclease/exonuclease/phosphatase [Candidatus Saccharibacteria bacterium]